MDTVAAFTAPFLVDLAATSLSEFLGRSNLRVVQTHDDGRPFGLLLKSLLHGRLGTSLRCARMDLRSLDVDSPDVRAAFQSWVDLAGVQDVFPPPCGYYLLRGQKVVGFHPAAEAGLSDRGELARSVARGLASLVSAHELRRAGVEALDGRPELEILRFFERAATSQIPLRAPAARDRRSGRGRRTGPRTGTPRREQERIRSELDRAFRVLGLPSDAPLQAVKEVRNRLMRANHPDLLADQPERMAEATRFTVRVNAAYAAIRRAREAGLSA